MILNKQLYGGIRGLAATVTRFYLGNARGRAFMLKFGKTLQAGARKRDQLEKRGTHIPPLIIASVTSQCNLRCAGCYARANGGCTPGEEADMTTEEWRHVLAQAADLGVSFVLFAGGEPLMRRDLIELAARCETLAFPIFTNGTLLDDGYLSLLDAHRHLIPVLSIEGDEAQTDARRGEGVSQKLRAAMEALRARGILYGASITVTRENADAVTRPEYVAGLREAGCGLLFYIEYIPAERGTDALTLDAQALSEHQARVDALRADKRNAGLHFICFPSDEYALGACLAAGQGFFHINARGGAEPCPFSPHSEQNVRRDALLDVIASPFFARVRTLSAAESGEHHGGCLLFSHSEQVRQARQE